MTDSVSRPGKRERLVASAGDLIHRQGVAATTIAQVAAAADVPPGNVYYYFKTKDELIQALIQARGTELDAMLATLEHRRTPAARLKALARGWADMREVIAEHGCPMGTLCADLDGTSEPLHAAAAALLHRVVDWAETQFHAMGRRDAHELAITLFASVQGAAALTNAFRDPELMAGQVRALERWIDGLS